MFFQTNLIEPSRIDTVLASENPSLLEILDEDDVIQQCIGKNTKLVDFLCDDENFNNMLNLILTEPDDSLDISLQHKYPSRACEVLTCRIPEFTGKLVESDDTIERIISFIDHRVHKLTPLHASFCVKLVDHMHKVATKNIYDYLEKHPAEIIDILISSLHLPCVLELLLQFSYQVEDIDCDIPSADGFLAPLVDAGLAGALINVLSPKEINETTRDAAVNSSQLICEVLKINFSPLPKALLSKESLDALFSVMFPSETTSVPEFVLTNGFDIINTILSQDYADVDSVCIKADPIPLDDMESIDEQSAPRGHAPLARVAQKMPDYMKYLSISLLKHLSYIRAILVNAPPQYPLFRMCLSSTMNCDKENNTPPLGRLRLKVVDCLQLLVKQRNAKLNQAIAENDLMQLVFKLLLDYRWNSLLHNSVERMCSTILSTSSEVESLLLKKLLCDCELIRVILDTIQDKEKQGNNCAGYSGQILLIANQLSKAMKERSSEISALIPVETLESWRKFENETLVTINEQNEPEECQNSTFKVGGGLRLTAPRRPFRQDLFDDEEEDDEDNNDGDSNEAVFVSTILNQMTTEYEKQDLSAKPITSFSFPISGLELDPSKSLLSDLPPLPRVPINVLPPEHRKRLNSSDEDSDDEMEDSETAFERACQEQVKVASGKITKSDDGSDSGGEEDEIWRDEELQQGNFAPAKHAHSTHIFEDSQGNVREVKESEWQPFSSSTPEQMNPGSPPNKSGLELMDDDEENSSEHSSSSGQDEASDFQPFADFSALSGSEWPNSASSNANDEWPGSSEEKMDASFEVKFSDAFTKSDDSDQQSGENKQPSKIPPAIPPRIGKAPTEAQNQ